MAEVDEELAAKLCGLVSADLVDIDYLSLYLDGCRPAEAALAAMNNMAGIED